MTTQIKEQVFMVDKETDNNVRLKAGKDQPLFGSLYVNKEMWPKGATGVTLQLVFIYEKEGETSD